MSDLFKHKAFSKAFLTTGHSQVTQQDFRNFCP